MKARIWTVLLNSSVTLSKLLNLQEPYFLYKIGASLQSSKSGVESHWFLMQLASFPTPNIFSL